MSTQFETNLYQPNPDGELERQIEFQHGLLVTAITPAEQKAACEEMTRLIGQRSPARVEQMERERGLR